jgi:hypothetical protein
MDVKTAFLYGLVEETVYIQQPLGLEDKSAGLDKVCKLNRALWSKTSTKSLVQHAVRILTRAWL